MREEFMITRQGKQYVLFQGLLDEAHTQGLRGITTEMIQSPFDPESDGTAIVRAVVAMPPSENDPEQKPRSFSGIGDANASARQAGPAEKGAPLRMAETRAKARALRDAINVGVTAFEELGGDDSEAAAPQPQKRPQAAKKPNEKPQASKGEAPPDNVAQLKGSATKAPKPPKNAAKKQQRDSIEAMLTQLWPGKEEAYTKRILDNLEVSSLKQITQDQAEEILEWLRGKIAEKQPENQQEEPEDEVEDFDEDAVE